MKKFLLLLSLFISANIFSQSQGPNSPGTAVDPISMCLACPGAYWSNIPAVMASDNNFATVTLYTNGTCIPNSGNCFWSRYIYASNFGFSIPANATVVGIVAEAEGMSNTAAVVMDSTIKLWKGGPAGTNHALLTPWGTVNAYMVHGNPADLWGTSWLYSDINAAGFGMYLKVYNTSGNVMPQVSVDHVRITVYYTIASGLYSQTAFAGNTTTYYSAGDDAINISFELAADAKCSIELYNTVGQLLNSRAQSFSAGKNSERIETRDLATGIYFVKLTSGSSTLTRKVVVY